MIRKISWTKIVDLLHSAKKRIVLVMPAIHEEWIEIIKQNESKSHIDIKVCVDNSEAVIRNGYGSIKSMVELGNLGATIKECNGLRVNFLCADDESYCLFLESRILAGDPEGFNALEMNKESCEIIINEFFPVLNIANVNLEREVITVPFQEDKFKEIKLSIEKNPPEEPDLKRKISTYTTLFQYAELHFEGGNLSSKTITIPPSALPFKNAELKKRMKARISLFTKEITDEWKELSDLKNKVESVRKEFLVTCSIRKEKSILKKEKKEAFQKAIEELKKLAEESTKKILDKVQTAINNSEDTLRSELAAFFKLNPPDSVKGLISENIERQVEKEIQKIIFQIDLPDAASLISKMKLQEMYYELTWEDLKDEKLMKWFESKNLIGNDDIDKLARFGKAFDVKR